MMKEVKLQIIIRLEYYDFKVYIGKVQLDDGTIIDIPPLSFKKNVYVESYNPVTDTINAGARTKRLFNGTVEDYKKQKK